MSSDVDFRISDLRILRDLRLVGILSHRPMLYQLSYAHHTLIGNSLTLFLSRCFCLHVCNRRQLSDFIRMELRSSIRLSLNHFVTGDWEEIGNLGKGGQSKVI